MEYCNLTGREFKIVVMKKLSKQQKIQKSQVSELRNKMNEQKEYFVKEI